MLHQKLIEDDYESSPILPNHIQYVSYNINKLKEANYKRSFICKYVEINFEYTEREEDHFQTSIDFKRIIPDGKFQLSKFNLEYLLDKVKNIPDTGEVLIKLSYSNKIFKGINMRKMVSKRFYSYRVFDLRSYFNKVDVKRVPTKLLKFIPHAASYSTDSNFFLHIFGTIPRYNKRQRYTHFIKTGLNLLTHLKKVKYLDQMCEIRLTEEQKNIIFR